MKENLISGALLFLLLVSPALAHDPIVTLDRIDVVEVVPHVNTEVFVPGFPYELTFEGTITHEGKGNMNHVILSATVNDELIYGPDTFKGSGNKTVSNYSIPWTVWRPGQYNITITALHRTSDSDNGCKAAPAIATDYLKEMGINNKSAEENTITKVAQETGKKGSLWAKDSCAEYYEAQTITFVTEILE